MEYSCKAGMVTKLPYFHVKLATLKVALGPFLVVLFSKAVFLVLMPIVLSLSRDSRTLLLENMQIMQG